MRPRESYDQRLLSSKLTITPQPDRMRWMHDVFGNAVAIAGFSGEADQLEVRATAIVEHWPTDRAQIALEPYAANYPFHYSAQDLPDLARSTERQFADPGRQIDKWVSRFVGEQGETPTLDLLEQMTTAIQSDFTYRAREEEGTQAPRETLEQRTGTCRDYAVLMMEAARALGFAARFISGYLYETGSGKARVGGQSTHAWVCVFLPGSGWVEFDPTNGIIGNNGLIRVAVARDPFHAKPMIGSWSGPEGSDIDMSVDVRIERLADDAASDDSALGKETSTC
jgi:transglutaminase-like putative cysteine protease